MNPCFLLVTCLSCVSLSNKSCFWVKSMDDEKTCVSSIFDVNFIVTRRLFTPESCHDDFFFPVLHSVSSDNNNNINNHLTGRNNNNNINTYDNTINTTASASNASTTPAPHTNTTTTTITIILSPRPATVATVAYITPSPQTTVTTVTTLPSPTSTMRVATILPPHPSEIPHILNRGKTNNSTTYNYGTLFIIIGIFVFVVIAALLDIYFFAFYRLYRYCTGYRAVRIEQDLDESLDVEEVELVSYLQREENVREPSLVRPTSMLFNKQYIAAVCEDAEEVSLLNIV